MTVNEAALCRLRASLTLASIWLTASSLMRLGTGRKRPSFCARGPWAVAGATGASAARARATARVTRRPARRARRAGSVQFREGATMRSPRRQIPLLRLRSSRRQAAIGDLATPLGEVVSRDPDQGAPAPGPEHGERPCHYKGAGK